MRLHLFAVNSKTLDERTQVTFVWSSFIWMTSMHNVSIVTNQKISSATIGMYFLMMKIDTFHPLHNISEAGYQNFGLFRGMKRGFNVVVDTGHRCPNYEGVVFQPRIFPTPHLVSVAYCYSLIYPFCPTFFLYRFLYCYFPRISYLLPICSRSSLKPSQFHPLPTSSPGAKFCPPVHRPHPPPTSFCRSSLRPAPHACIFFRSRAGLLPPLPPSEFTQFHVVPRGFNIVECVEIEDKIAWKQAEMYESYLKFYHCRKKGY